MKFALNFTQIFHRQKMSSFYLTIASICVAIFMVNSTPTSFTIGVERVSQFLDQICLKLGVKWSAPWRSDTSQHNNNRRTCVLTLVDVFVDETEFHLLLTVLEALSETDLQTVVNAIKKQIVDGRREENNGERATGLDLPMMFAIFRFVFEQYQSAQTDGNEASKILSHWLIDAFDLVRPVNALMSVQQAQNTNEVIDLLIRRFRSRY